MLSLYLIKKQVDKYNRLRKIEHLDPNAQKEVSGLAKQALGLILFFMIIFFIIPFYLCWKCNANSSFMMRLVWCWFIISLLGPLYLLFYIVNYVVLKKPCGVAS